MCEIGSRTTNSDFNRPPSAGGNMTEMIRMADRKFTFIAHWIEPVSLLLKYRAFWWLHRDFNRSRSVMWLDSLCRRASERYLKGQRAFDVVDEFRLAGISGETVVIRNFFHHFLLRTERERIIDRICSAVISAQDRGSTVVGLGALTKDESLTRGGQVIVSRLGSDLQIPVVHGDTMTAAVVFEQAMRLIERFDLGGAPVFLIGATSKIGRAVAISLARRGVRVRMLTESLSRFENIKREAGQFGSYMEFTDKVESGHDCRFWITGKARPSGEAVVRHLPMGAVVLNFSVPDPLEGYLGLRPDVYHLDGGLVYFDPRTSSQWFRMRLKPGFMHACHAGTVIHAHQRWRHSEVGPVEVDRMGMTLEVGQNIGFSLPPYTSFLQPIELPTRIAGQPMRLPSNL